MQVAADQERVSAVQFVEGRGDPGRLFGGPVGDRSVRRSGESVVGAVRRAFLDAVSRNDPTLGIDAGMVAFWRVVDDSPALQARLRLIAELTEAALAEELAETSRPITDPTIPEVTAALIAGVDRALHAHIRRRLSLGEDGDTVRTAIRDAAERAFAALDLAIRAYGETSEISSAKR
jgi:AcrR family transcriptional regulator